jgi:glycosyltransferase involved in cell wall biosynthesis
MKGSLSVAIVACNEEERLPDCLESAGFADEIVLVDGGSRDRTVEIARRFGCRVSEQPWQGFARQKQLAVDRCRNDWVLILDADERVPPETAVSLRQLTLGDDCPTAAFSFTRRNIFHGRWIRRCGWWPDRVTRLVDRRRGRFSTRLVHEQWLADGPVEPLEASLEHRSFRGYADLLVKLQRYSSLSAREMLAAGDTARWWSGPAHGLWMFISTYVLQLGVLEGFDGFMISAMNAGGSFMKYARLYELQRYGDGELKRSQ